MLFALKIDVDTFRGMREGLPRLLDILRTRKILATIFVSMGPDHSGRAIRRIFTKPGFLGKMLRTKAVSLYGPRTVLYGTLLPGPRIAQRNAELFRRIEAEGHEAGVHGWDHVRWQDGLPGFDQETIGRELARAFAVFEEITGHRPRATAAPGWIANARSLAVQDGLDLGYCADVRGEFPFLPRMGARQFRTPQIPTTLPTLDELIGRDRGAAPPDHAAPGNPAAPTGGGGGRAAAGARVGTDESWINVWLVSEASRQARARPASPVVHTIHTEVEGLSRAALFADLLDRLLAEGARFARLDAALESFRARGAGQSPAASSEEPLPQVPLAVCEVRDGTLPGRSGTLAIQSIEGPA